MSDLSHSAGNDDPAGDIPATGRLTALGWDTAWQQTRTALNTGGTTPDPVTPGADLLHPGRVARVDRNSVRVLTDGDNVDVPLHGSDGVPGSPDPSTSLNDRIVTGDWVLLGDEGVAAVLPRRTALVRGAGGRATRAQVLAANVDVVMIVVALNTAPSAARLDRMLALAWNSGAQPVVVLSKADLSPSAETERDEVAENALGVPTHLVSVVDGRGLDEVRASLGPGRTAAMLGVSGSGKSSLVNALAGTEILPVGEIRSDGKGRHTTTSRDLVILPGCGVFLDTPGLRGVQLWTDADEGLDRTFADVEDLARQCQFRDCAHQGDSGCAVAEAVADGRLAARRLASYHKLHREMAWLESRYDARLRAEQRRKWKRFERAHRNRGRP